MEMESDLSVYNRHENDDSESVSSTEDLQEGIPEEPFDDDLYEEIDELVEEHREKLYEPVEQHADVSSPWSLGYCMYLNKSQHEPQQQNQQPLLGTTIPTTVFFKYPIHVVQEYIFETTQYARQESQHALDHNERQPQSVQVQLIKLVKNADGSFNPINKIHVLRNIQKRWKHVYHEHIINMKHMCLQKRVHKHAFTNIYKHISHVRKLTGLLSLR